jgi:MFS transporter, SP family, arabinose:H+ symporter
MVSEAKAGQPSGRNVIADLDSRIPTNFYWYLAVLACIGGFLFGYDTSNIGSALGFIPYHLSSFATGYLVAGASLGAAAGALIAGPLTDHFGRKVLLITDAAIYAVGAILSAVTVDAGMLLASRTLIGLAIGADSAIATSYIAEFAPSSRRGQLSIIQQWMITVGILVSYIVAVIILEIAPGSAGTSDWRLILGLGGIPALVAVVLRSHMPESPRWLMLHGRYDDTRKAFGRLGMERRAKPGLSRMSRRHCVPGRNAAGMPRRSGSIRTARLVMRRLHDADPLRCHIVCRLEPPRELGRDHT